MKGELTSGVSEQEIREEVDRILQSRAFRNSERLQRFLRFAVDAVLENATDQLKESVLGRTVFDRGSEYDPRMDSIVRVESQRLRRRIREYYDGEGKGDTVSITFRPGSYVPVFSYRSALETSESEEPSQPPETRPPNPQTVAVLPFTNQSAEPDQEFFCDGITDDIIFALSRIPGLTVIGHTSVFALKGAAQDVREIGRRLGAGTVVDGSVRKSGNRLKIFAEMLDAATGEVQWAEAYDRTVEDVFTLEAEIAHAVARVLQMTLAPPISRRLIRGAPNMGAYELYLRGRYEWNRMSAAGYKQAVEIFQRAISEFPSYASLYVGLADAYTYLALWGWERPREAFPKAREAALQALKLDPFLPHAHSTLAATRALFEWKWQESLELARKATQLEPSYSFGQHIYGTCLLSRGRTEEARECFERAVVLDPLSVRAHRTLGWCLYLQRRPASAEKWLQAALALDREPLQTQYLLAHVYLNQRRYAAALHLARQTQSEPPDPLALGLLGACLAHMDQRKDALEIAAKLSELAGFGYIDPGAIAQVQIALDNTDLALEAISRSLDERTPALVALRLDPQFDPLRSDPRFQKLVSRLAL